MSDSEVRGRARLDGSAEADNYVLLGVVWLCWGFSYPASKILLGSFDVWTSRVLVMLASAGLLLGLATVRRRSLVVPRAQWTALAVAALCNMMVFQVCMTFGVHYFSAGRTAVVVYTMPLWAMLFAWLLLGERPTRARLAALALGLAGLAVLMSQDFEQLRNAPLGAGLTLVAAVAFGFGTVWMKRCVWRNDLTVVAGWQLFIAAIPITLTWPLFGRPVDWEAVSAPSWVALGYMVLFANGVAYAAWFRVVRHFPATVTGLSTMAVPVVAVLASVLVLDEVVGWREVVALSLILAALALNLLPASAIRRAPRKSGS